ncbi:hypothetical protein EON63_20925 [archaeon]|nr:MAG: hypothetical protein EON63_20925 [archaeon]
MGYGVWYKVCVLWCMVCYLICPIKYSFSSASSSCRNTAAESLHAHTHIISTNACININI